MHLDEGRHRTSRPGVGSNAGRIQSHGLHGFTHGDASAIEMVQHCLVKATRHRATAQQGGLEAHALFLGKADHLDRKRKAPPRPVPLGNASQRQDDAQVAVIFAGIAHGIEVRASDQGRGLFMAGRGFVAADHVAGIVAPHAHAGLLHPVRQFAGGGLVHGREVGPGQHAGRFRVPGQLFGPLHGLLAGLAKRLRHGMDGIHSRLLVLARLRDGSGLEKIRLFYCIQKLYAI
jgi:hypothetical protein